MTFASSEIAMIEEAVRRRSDNFERPVWMQPYRHTACVLEVRKRIAAFPAPSGGRGARAHYHANRRIRAKPEAGRSNKVHEAGADGLPICAMRTTFEDWVAEGSEIVELGGGPVTCGHCANAKSR